MMSTREVSMATLEAGTNPASGHQLAPLDKKLHLPTLCGRLHVTNYANFYFGATSPLMPRSSIGSFSIDDDNATN